MSWNDFYRRRDALDTVLRLASRDPARPLPFAEVPGAAEIFTGPAEVLLALHYRWSLQLTGRLGLALAEADRDPSIDRVDAVVRAWRQAATEHAALRGLLDAHADDHDGALLPALESEQRMLAMAAGLAEPGEPAAEITRVGAALLALVRTAPPEPADPPARSRRRHPAKQFLRRLVPNV